MEIVNKWFKPIKRQFCLSHKCIVSDAARVCFYVMFCTLFIVFIGLSISWCRISEYDFTLERIISALLYMGAVICISLKISQFSTQKIGIIIFFLSLIMNVVVIDLMGQNSIQIYDYRIAYDTSFQEFGEWCEKSVVFPTWAMYPIYLKAVNSVFGYNVMTGIMLNGFMVSASSSLLYAAAKRFLPIKISVLAALIFAAWPSFLEYMIMLSPEFVFIFLSLLATVLCIKAYDSKKTVPKFIYASFTAIVLSFANFFKSVVPVIIIAAGIVLLLTMIEKRKNILKHLKNMSSKLILTNTAVIFVSVFLFIITCFSGNYFMECFYGAKLNPSAQSYYMTIGLSSTSRGYFNPEICDRYFIMLRENSYDFDKVNNMFYDSLWEDIKTNNHIDAGFIKDKLTYSFGNDDYTVMVDMTVNDSSLPGLALWRDFFAPFNQVWYIICLIFIAISAFVNIIYNDKKLILYSSIMIFGFVLLILLSEAQPRYKSVFYPLFSILTANGLYVFINIFNKINIRRMRHVK